jgi:hypothetical protein
MRRIGAAVVPAVARVVIDAPCAPGPAAVGWRRSPDRRAQQRRRPPPRPSRAAPVAPPHPAPPAPGSAVGAPPPLCCVAMTGAPVIGSFGAPRRIGVAAARRTRRRSGSGARYAYRAACSAAPAKGSLSGSRVGVGVGEYALYSISEGRAATELPTNTNAIVATKATTTNQTICFLPFI